MSQRPFLFFVKFMQCFIVTVLLYFSSSAIQFLSVVFSMVYTFSFIWLAESVHTYVADFCAHHFSCYTPYL